MKHDPGIKADCLLPDTGLSEEVFIVRLDKAVEDYSQLSDIAVFLSSTDELIVQLNSYDIPMEKALAGLGIKAPFVLNPGDKFTDTA